MKTGIRYIVTKGSDDGTFEVGDRIWLQPDGSIGCAQAGGWVSGCDAPAALKGMEYEVDDEWVARRKAKLLAELEELK